MAGPPPEQSLIPRLMDLIDRIEHGIVNQHEERFLIEEAIEAIEFSHEDPRVDTVKTNAEIKATSWVIPDVGVAYLRSQPVEGGEDIKWLVYDERKADRRSSVGCGRRKRMEADHGRRKGHVRRRRNRRKP